MNYWAWGGKYIGERIGNYLYSADGSPIGYFYGDEIYDFSGRYIGEIKESERIIVDISKKNNKSAIKGKPCNKPGCSHGNYAGYAMIVGYEDFEY